jgi:cell division protein FtsL
MMSRLSFLLLSSMVLSANAFVTPTQMTRQTAQSPTAMQSAFDGIKEPIQSYVDIW